MKKVLSVICFASVMASTTVFALTPSTGATNIAGQGVVKSKHNMLLYTETDKDDQGRVCAYCHTPHHALAGTATADYMPLWSHQLPTATFEAYKSPTVAVTATDPLRGATILCMSCHDGVVAVDQHYGSTNGAHVTTEVGWAGTAVGLHNSGGKIDLSNDHPIGFSYDEALRNHGSDLNQKSTQWRAGGKTIENVLTGGDFFTCASCHDVHNKDNVGNLTNTAVNYFLYADQTNSAFCLVCHNK